MDAEVTRRLGVLAEAVAAREVRSRLDHARLRASDTALWPPAGEVTRPWLGWLDSLDRAPRHLRRIVPLAAELRAEGIRDVVLVGMGGSSLFPLVLAGTCIGGPDAPRLHVLDSTDPAAVLRVEASIDPARTVLVVASKSGTTVETLAHLDRLMALLTATLGEAAHSRLVVVTDPGSPLAARAERTGSRAVIHGDADVGGRYSALSPFGLLPAALLGLDVDRMLGHARAAAARWTADPWTGGGPAAIAALLAAGVASGRDAVHLVVDGRAGMLGAWIEQLVAESSGKDGTGVLPVVVAHADDVVAADRAVAIVIGDVSAAEALVARGVPTLVLAWPGPEHLLAEALRWMEAVPILCAQLGVDPFDQPDVAAAKVATAEALASGTEPDAPVALADLDAVLADAGYVAVLAYVDPDGPVADRVMRSTRALAQGRSVPVTLGFGPRYLHSTGQLHKGGRADAVLLVLLGDDPEDAAIPGRTHGFARLKRAQAAGDIAALRAAGRRVARIALDDPLLAAGEAGSATV